MSRPRAAVLLAVLLSFALLRPAAAQEDGFRLDDAVVPTFQAVDLRLDPDRPDYTGRVRIELRCDRAAESFRLHAEEMDLEAVRLEGPTGPIPVQARPMDFEQVEIVPDLPLAPGSAYTLQIDFAQEFDTTARGLYRLVTGDRGYLFTQFEATDARQAFPCFDEPRFKIAWEMTVAVPEGQEIVSNTPVAEESLEGGWRTVRFARTHPMPSYLLALAAGPLESVPVEGMDVPGRILCVQGKSGLTAEAAAMIPPLLKALEDYFGRRYPYAKLDMVAVPEFWAGAMENVGLITYRETLLLLDPQTATTGQRRAAASVIAHEMAHMWFGNLVTMQWWDDLWLNESFATWIGNKVTDEVFPQYGIAVSNVRAAQGAMGTDALATARAIRQPVHDDQQILQSADDLTYSKGMAVLGMFEAWMGEDLFRQAVVSYLEAHEWGNARAKDLWGALSETSGVDVGAAMATFLDQSGVPLVTATDLGDGRVELRQERYVPAGSDLSPESRRWELPVSFRYHDGRQSRVHRLLLTQERQVVDVPASGELAWIHPNDGETGYYRWEVAPAMLRRMAEAAPEILSARERVAFTDNAEALLDAGRMDGPTFLQTVGELASDPRPEVVDAALAHLGPVRMAFVTPDLEEAFAAFVRRTLEPARRRFGLTPTVGEADAVALLRPDLVSWLGKYGRDPEVIAYAKEVTRSYLQDRASVDPEVVGACLQIAALDGDWVLYNAYKKNFEEAVVPAERQRFLAALGWFRQEVMVKAALHYTLTGDLRPQERFVIPMGLGSAGDEERALLWQWMTDNYDRILEYIPPMFSVYLPWFAGGCSAERLEAARAFFDPQGEHFRAGQEKELEKVAETTANCIGLRQREGEAVARYLRDLAGL